MSPIRLLGLGVAAAGVVFVLCGIGTTHVPLDQLGQLPRVLTEDFSHQTGLYLMGGLSALAAGAFIAVAKPE